MNDSLHSEKPIAGGHDDRKWTVLSSKYLWKRPWLTVRQEHVRLANGLEAPEFYILEYPDWVNVIAITKEGEMVMIRQYRHGVDRCDYELCAGVIEPDEDPEAAARRELLEETGFGGGEDRQTRAESFDSDQLVALFSCSGG